MKLLLIIISFLILSCNHKEDTSIMTYSIGYIEGYKSACEKEFEGNTPAEIIFSDKFRLYLLGQGYSVSDIEKTIEYLKVLKGK
jgi:hypothetical protein